MSTNRDQVKRERGTGRVYQRGSRWWVEFWFRGRQFRESAGDTEAEAKKKLKARLKEILGDRFVGPQAERVTVEELLDAYLAALRLKGAKAVRSVEKQLKPVREFFSLTRAVDVTTDLVRRYIEARLAAGRAPATVNRGVADLRAAFRLALKEGRLVRVPHFPMLRENNARQGFFEPAEFKAVVGNLPEPLDDVTRFAYVSGWRKSEILGLGWSDVDMRAGEVRLRDSKNSEPRSLPLEIGDLRAIIERRWAAREYRTGDDVTRLSEYVFHRDGRPIRDLKGAWATACEKAGLAQVETDEKGRKIAVRPLRLFHDLRRTAVRDLVRAGVPESVAMRVTGHKTAAVFRRYDITSDADRREALRRLEAYRAAQPSESKVVQFKPESGSR